MVKSGAQKDTETYVRLFGVRDSCTCLRFAKLALRGRPPEKLRILRICKGEIDVPNENATVGGARKHMCVLCLGVEVNCKRTLKLQVRGQGF